MWLVTQIIDHAFELGLTIAVGVISFSVIHFMNRYCRLLEQNQNQLRALTETLLKHSGRVEMLLHGNQQAMTHVATYLSHIKDQEDAAH